MAPTNSLIPDETTESIDNHSKWISHELSNFINRASVETGGTGSGLPSVEHKASAALAKRRNNRGPNKTGIIRISHLPARIA